MVHKLNGLPMRVESPVMSDHLVRMANIKALMEANGWKKSDLARAIRRTPQQLNNLFSGKATIGERLARDIEEALGLQRYALDDRPNSKGALSAAEPTPPTYGGGAALLRVTTGGKTFPLVGWEAVVTMLDSAVAPRAPSSFTLLDSFCEDASPRSVFVRVQDDSNSPIFNPGDLVLLDPSGELRAGSVILVRTHSGDLLLRRYRPRTSISWDAEPFNSAYATLNSVSDNLIILAKAIEHRRYMP